MFVARRIKLAAAAVSRPLSAKERGLLAASLNARHPNPMDLDYRALSNAGLWALGTLQTDADREPVIEGLAAGDRKADQALEQNGATIGEAVVRVARACTRILRRCSCSRGTP